MPTAPPTSSSSTRLEYAGDGALLARIEMLRSASPAKGLFDAARKRALPLLPRGHRRCHLGDAAR